MSDPDNIQELGNEWPLNVSMKSYENWTMAWGSAHGESEEEAYNTFGDWHDSYIRT